MCRSWSSFHLVSAQLELGIPVRAVLREVAGHGLVPFHPDDGAAPDILDDVARHGGAAGALYDRDGNSDAGVVDDIADGGDVAEIRAKAEPNARIRRVLDHVADNGSFRFGADADTG